MNKLLERWTRHLAASAMALAAVWAALGSGAAQAAYPDRPIRLIVGFPPGQATDVIARMLGKVLQDALGQPVVVENRPGAGGINGTVEAIRAAPDGYTLLVSSSGPLSVNPSLYAKLPYAPEKDLEPVSMLVRLPLYLAVNPSFPAKTFDEFLKLVKASPGKYDYASAGNGVTSHLTMELIKSQFGLFLLHVPYRGSGQAVSDVMAGQVPAIVDTGPAILPNMAAGKLRVLAVTTRERSSLTPAIASIAELSGTSFDVAAWVGLVAPRGVPPEIVEQLHKTIALHWTKPEVKSQMAALGGESVTMPPAAFRTYIAEETVKFARAVKISGAKVD
ncbi:tripartite tricarboxylate transporter substrate binding protein [Xylophilus rhododendri]|uniref:Tripartite tricarboxylate transporter substrate binding protein n=1 Tax=Xylophilus rhododendri TaxID=2697032 RepID=A0A857J2T2_9BURK|nr:tripartite tricarboxylate transporter substrate binding protein [Xylophilus rhododendri]QHI97208.1 tripartite tricarboxylate transporter substrate binding protein [Xylophilus rhododendri]